VVVPDTSIAGRTQSAGDGRIDDYRYWAPEIQWPEDRGLGKILLTTESDVYGMGMVVYEASCGCPAPPDPRAKSHINLLGFDGEQAVLRVQQYHRTLKYTCRENTSPTLQRYCESSLGVPRGMLEQGH